MDAYRRSLFGVGSGDKVYVVGNKGEYKKCEYCGGTHKIMVKVLDTDKIVECPKCDYHGNILTGREYFPKTYIVKYASIQVLTDESAYIKVSAVENDGTKREYETTDFVLYPSKADRYNAHCYYSLEDCKKACEEMQLIWNEKRV